MNSEKVVVVAGAGGPTGKAVVRRLVTAGAHVITADVRPHEWDDKRVTGTVIDLLDFDGVRAWSAEIRGAHGRVDGLVHLVGGWRGGKTFGDTDLADWTFLNDLLIRTLQHTTLAFHDAIRTSPQGRFAIVSQPAAQHPAQGGAAYAAAKAAAEAWTLALADSFTGSGAAATILVVKALLNDAMREAKPDAAFSGYTHVNDLAAAITGLWDRPSDELNGQRIALY
ncbi:MAG TPA: SDR family NAD(P)-dependent oxidoreductase [Streptosporangiaceae bacterium]|nr:SDR family NAD(P)-dependent oxidoreductase [Streptosporangiaceae bacterium]